ncbi:hypothetical protein KUTeg_005563 [Tegillarca granosa]|uniref:beta-N-acetylhexosaminidase n=1 Tax=Tegillarca granosa TaxID=220873 RepID=A0ABQ9FK69_TEGGR|nr:hypothetical protein KUTeg_005563 [Tegillarca granosa]
MARSKSNGKVCMFLVGASLILVILLSYKWFMVPSGVQKERKSSLYYRQQRLQKLKNERNSFGKDRGRNFFNDRSLTGSKKHRYMDESAKKTTVGMAGTDSRNNRFVGTATKQPNIWDKDRGSEENVGRKDSGEVKLPAPKIVKMTTSLEKDSSIKSLYKDAEPLYTDTFNKMIRIVHLDLKGSPPNMEYLKKLLPFLKNLGATGLLIEYEDMFPYSGKLAPLAAKNCYSIEDIHTINKLAQDNSLDIMPLIQTFGHMEFALKSEFAHLRENDKLPLVIHPGKNETYDFLYEMIDQVMKLHSGKRFLHIGADEVYTLGRGKSKDMLTGNTTKATLFFRHVKRVAKYVKNKHGARPIIWDDMFRHVDSDVLKASKIGKLVSPMVWSYVKDPRERLPQNLWKKYRSVFSTIWIASAFKGATGVAQFATDPLHHIRNHLSWVDILKKEVLSEAGTMQLTGVALTGWSRYDHFAVLCELLPGAIPSLAASLQIMSTGGFSESDHKKVSDLLQCKKNVQFELCMNQTDDECQFPGNEVYYKIRKLWRVKKSYSRCMETYKGWVSEYNIKYAFSSPYQIQKLRKSLINIATNMSRIEKFMWNGITALYDNYTAAEWIEVNLRTILNKIPEKMKNLDLLLNPTTWQKRPFNILISPPAGTNQYQIQAGQGQNRGLGQNQISGPFLGQNQFQSQGQNRGSGQSPSLQQNKGPGQNSISGQNQEQTQSGRRDSNTVIQNLDNSGKNLIPGQNQQSGQRQRSPYQFPGQNQLPGQQHSTFNIFNKALNRARSGQNDLQSQGQVQDQKQLTGGKPGQNSFPGSERRDNQLPEQGQGQGQDRLGRQNQLPGWQQNQRQGQNPFLGQGQNAGDRQNEKKTEVLMAGKNDNPDKMQNTGLSQDKQNKMINSGEAGSKKDEKVKEGEKKKDMIGNVLQKPPSLNNPAIGQEKDKRNEQEKDKNQGSQRDGEKKERGKDESHGNPGNKDSYKRFANIGQRLSVGLNDARPKSKLFQ